MIYDGVTHPRWSLGLLNGMPQLGNFVRRPSPARDEVDRTFAQIGCPSVGQLSADYVMADGSMDRERATFGSHPGESILMTSSLTKCVRSRQKASPCVEGLPSNGAGRPPKRRSGASDFSSIVRPTASILASSSDFHALRPGEVTLHSARSAMV